MRSIRFFLLLMLFTLLLAACGSGASAPSSGAAPTTAPAAAAPTAAAAEATAAPAAGDPAPAPTPPLPTSSPQATAAAAAEPPAAGDIRFGTPTPYTQQNGLFTFEVPSDWQVEDRSTDAEGEIIALDPSGAATFIARVTSGGAATDPAQSLPELERYLKETLGAEDVTVSGGVPNADGRLPVEFSYTRTLEGEPVPSSGGGYIAHRGNLISFVVYTAPAEQLVFARNDFEQIANSYELAPDAQLK